MVIWTYTKIRAAALRSSSYLHHFSDKDGNRGHEQMVIALLCSAKGCPVGVEVFAGNTQDASTVPEKIAQLQRQYGLKEIIFVGDRGMITKAVANKIKGTEGLHTIEPISQGLPPEMPEEVRNLVTFKDLGGDKTEVSLTEYDWPVGHMMEMSKMGMEQCLDKMAAIFAKP